MFVITSLSTRALVNKRVSERKMMKEDDAVAVSYEDRHDVK